MIFLTADSHFGHANVIRYCDRPFETKDEHDQTLVDNWNTVVRPKDVVYHLGDFGFGNVDYIHKIAQRLHGQIILIKGNHDSGKMIRRLSDRFQTVKDTHFVRHGGHKIFMSHYAHRTWPSSNHGSWHIFGHSHGNLPPHGLSVDVGVDVWNYTPISFDQLKEFMDTRKKELDYTPKQ